MSVTGMQKQFEQEVCDYVSNVYDALQKKYLHEVEFLQTVKALFQTIIPVLQIHPEYMKYRVLERFVEPDRIVMFKVPWVDDQGQVQINTGYRVQFNNAVGPYKGGIRFDPSVNLSLLKSLAFQQTVKNALSGQPIGGAKGGADFDPKDKSDLEIMRFCQSFMTELSRHIGPDTDVPAGDLGVGAREIGYMFGQYKRIKGAYEAGVITGKGVQYGGSLGRTEATGYGAIYFIEEMLKENGLSLEDQKVVVSGSGNVALHVMEKATEKGAKVIACSDSSGYIFDEKGLDIQAIKRLKLEEKERIQKYVDLYPEATYCNQCSDIWTIPCDIAFPCATQYEIDQSAAKALIKNGVKVVAEGANMPSSQEAIDAFLSEGVLFGPAQAVNAGGVIVSSLEMAQNSSREAWTFSEVDRRLKQIMKNIYQNCMEEAKRYHAANNLAVGANIAGFKKVADAMIVQGVI